MKPKPHISIKNGSWIVEILMFGNVLAWEGNCLQSAWGKYCASMRGKWQAQ